MFCHPPTPANNRIFLNQWFYIFFLIGLTIAAPPTRAADIKLRDGTEYRDVKVSRADPDGIVIITKTGVIKLRLPDLTKEWQEKYHYDEAKAAEYTASQTAKRRAFTEQINSSPSGVSSTPAEHHEATPHQSVTAPSPPAAPPAAMSSGAIISLSASWDSVMQGGSATARDLSRLLSPHAEPVRNKGPAPAIPLYRGVHYLMPLSQALQRLGLEHRPTSRNSVICPGLPRGSLFYYSVDGTFEGEYNRICIIVDQTDQVVSIQLVSENPQQSTGRAKRKGQIDWYCYNFINYRVKGLKSLEIDHEVKAGKDTHPAGKEHSLRRARTAKCLNR